MHRFGRILIIVGLLAGTASCNLLGPREDDRSMLEAARARWDTAGVLSYEYVFDTWCVECQPVPPMTIRVVDDFAVGARGGSGEDPPEWFTPRTIPALFSQIADAIDSRRVDIDATYDGTLGHPLSVTFIGRDPNVMDDISGFGATNVSPLAP
jgi:hypothetical protein